MNNSLTHALITYTNGFLTKSRLCRQVAVILMSTIAVSSAAGSIRVAVNPAEDVILQWNKVLELTVKTAGQQPPTIVASRSYSMMHGAMFDAVNSIDGSYTPYLIEVPGTKNASIEAAAAQAAHDVLVALYPSRASIFDAELQASLAGLPASRVRQGVRIGQSAAAAMLADRADDGWTATPPPYLPLPVAGNWQPTPTAFAPAAFTHYPNVKPFVLASSEQFRPTPPPALGSSEYAAAFNEVKAIGSSTSSTRTADQTQAAQAWASIGNPTGVAVFWNTIARNLSAPRGLTTVENARLFAMINMSTHDALETSFASKFHYGLWRPVTAIRRADEDGNSATDQDTAWSSLIPTPPYPTYAGNMAAIGMANAGVMALVFGRDDLAAQYTFPLPTGPTRSWASLSAIADEATKSREWGGIHFSFDSVAGQSIGLNTANYVFTHSMTAR
jgi:hypothetical protein